METAISIPEPLFEAGEKLATRLGISRNELYLRALSEYVSANLEDSVTEALNRVYSGEDSTLDPSLARLQSASLPEDDWVLYDYGRRPI